MSTAANVVLFADQGEPDWVAQTAFYGSPTASPNNALVFSTGIAADSNGNIVGIAVGNDGGAGFGLHCYNKYGGLTQLRLSNPIQAGGGQNVSPAGTAVTLPDGSVKVFYTPTFTDPGGFNTTQAFNIFNVDVATGAYTTFAVGRDAAVNFNDGGFTIMTSAGGDSGGNFYGCGFTRRSGGVEYPYLVKYNSAGAIQWTIVLQPQLQRVTGGGVETANFGTGAAVTVDNDGNSYVRLRHTTNSQIPTFTEKLMKFNSSGTQQWVRIVEGPQGGTPSATDGTYVYSADTPTSTTTRVVATNVSDGTVAWERTLTVTGNTFVGVRGVIASGGHVYVLSQANNGLSGADSNNGMTWMKLSTSGNFEWNRHIFASSTLIFGTTFDQAFQGIIAGSKMYTTFRAVDGIATVKLPLDGSKLGMLGSMPYASGIPNGFSYTERQADINVVELPMTAATTSTATSTASTYGTTTTTITTSDVFVLGLDVTLDKSQINAILAPKKITRPAVLYAKRQLR
jgi:hypothetical protein